MRDTVRISLTDFFSRNLPGQPLQIGQLLQIFQEIAQCE